MHARWKTVLGGTQVMRSQPTSYIHKKYSPPRRTFSQRNSERYSPAETTRADVTAKRNILAVLILGNWACWPLGPHFLRPYPYPSPEPPCSRNQRTVCHSDRPRAAPEKATFHTRNETIPQHPACRWNWYSPIVAPQE